jgi:hypothetical protein
MTTISHKIVEFQVYVRRAYISYEMVSLQHSIIGSQDRHSISSDSLHTKLSNTTSRDSSIPCAVYHFILPSSHPSIVNHSPNSSSAASIQSPSIAVTSESSDENQIISYSNYRVGLIAAFNTIEQLEVSFNSFNSLQNSVQLISKLITFLDTFR